MTDTTQNNNDLMELQSTIHAFTIIANVLNNSTFKPEHFQKIAITLSVITDIKTELQTQLEGKLELLKNAAQPAIIDTAETVNIENANIEAEST